MHAAHGIEQLLPDLPKLAIGDELLLRDVRRSAHSRDVTVVVTSIGRKWGTAQKPGGWQKVVFDLSTGLERSGQYSATQRVLTPGMEQEALLKREALDALLEHGIEVQHSKRRGINLATLQALVAVLAP